MHGVSIHHGVATYIVFTDPFTLAVRGAQRLSSPDRTNKHLRLLADDQGSYAWVPPSDFRVAEVRLLHDVQEGLARRAAVRSRAQDNLLIRGDALNALTSLCRAARVRTGIRRQGQARLPRPAVQHQQAFLHYDDALRSTRSG